MLALQLPLYHHLLKYAVLATLGMFAFASTYHLSSDEETAIPPGENARDEIEIEGLSG